MAKRAGGGRAAKERMPAAAAGPDLPGAGQGRAQALHELLVEELGPADAIERLWLADIAHLTARLEHLRAMQRGFYLQLLHDKLCPTFTMLGADFSGDELEILGEMAEQDFNLGDGEDPAHLDLFGRLLSAAIQPKLNQIKVLDDLERSLLRERDRVFAQFERRRRSQVADAVRELEQSQPSLPPPGA